MADYYHNTTQREREKRTPLLVRIFDFAMIIITPIFFLATLMIYISPLIHPAWTPIFPIIGLFAPVIYLLTVLLMLFWIARWRWIMALPLLMVVLIGVPRISLFARLDMSNRYVQREHTSGMKIMSYNVKGFTNESGSSNAMESYRAYVDAQKPDIICFQEFDVTAYNQRPFASLAKYDKHLVDGLAIFSRYPIIAKSGNIAPFKGSSNGAFWVDVLIGKDTVRIFNAHLRSTAIRIEDDNYLTSKQILTDSNREAKIRDIASRLYGRQVERTEQVSDLSKVVRASKGAVLLCGDFNDPPISYTYRRLSRGMQDAFRKAGYGYSSSFQGFMNMLRIDYIMASKEIEFVAFTCDDNMGSSDHFPLIANFKLK